MNLIFVGIVIFFAAYLANRQIMTTATRDLSDELKLRIFDVFSKRGSSAMLFLFALVVLFFAAMQFYPQYAFALTVAYSVLFFFYLILKFAANFKKLKQLAAPPFYMKSFVAAYGIFIVGFVCLGLCVIFNSYQ